MRMEETNELVVHYLTNIDFAAMMNSNLYVTNFYIAGFSVYTNGYTTIPEHTHPRLEWEIGVLIFWVCVLAAWCAWLTRLVKNHSHD